MKAPKPYARIAPSSTWKATWAAATDPAARAELSAMIRFLAAQKEAADLAALRAYRDAVEAQTCERCGKPTNTLRRKWCAVCAPIVFAHDSNAAKREAYRAEQAERRRRLPDQPETEG